MQDSTLLILACTFSYLFGINTGMLVFYCMDKHLSKRKDVRENSEETEEYNPFDQLEIRE